MNPASLELCSLSPERAPALLTFLRALKRAGQEATFHPHPFTKKHVDALSARPTKDIYLLALWRGRVIAYGMLRGWDEGYHVPSLGIAVHPLFQGRGIGQMMMCCLHAAAQLRNAPRIRLKVYPDNHSARALYKRVGYRITGRERGQLVAHKELAPLTQKRAGKK